MDARIILAGQPVNVLSAMAQGQGLAANQAQMQRTGEEWNLYRTHGAGIAEGDTNALRALAGFDPMAALNARGAHQEMAHADERMQLARAAAARAAQTHAAGLTAAERADMSERIGRGLATAIPALRAGDLAAVQTIFRTGGLEVPETLDDAAFVIAGYEAALPAFEAARAVMGAGAEAPAPTVRTLTLADGSEVAVQWDGAAREWVPINAPMGGGVAPVRERGEFDAPAVALEDIGRAIDIVEASPTLATGFIGSIVRRAPGTRAFDLAQLIETIGASVSFETLNQMRQNSPTGGALGQVTERELAMLRATLGSIEPGQSAAQLRANLERLERQFQEVVHGPGGARPTAAPRVGEVLDGWRFMGGDPSRRESWERVR